MHCLSKVKACPADASWHHRSTTTVLAVKIVCNRFDFMLAAVRKYWRTAIWSGCDLVDSKISRGFVHEQLVCFAPLLRTGWNSEYAIVPSPYNHLIINICFQDRASRCWQCPLTTASIDIELPQSKVTVAMTRKLFTVIEQARKLFDFRISSVSKLQGQLQSIEPAAARPSCHCSSEHELGHPTFKFIQKPMGGIARAWMQATWSPPRA